MNAREVMTSAVISATADTPVRDIAQLLLQSHISAVPILDKSGAPIGMVSEGDLVAVMKPNATLGASGGSRCWRKVNRSVPISFPAYVTPNASQATSCRGLSST